MITSIPPGLLLIAGAILVPFLRGNLRSAYVVALPLAGIWQMAMLEPGTFGVFSYVGFELTHVRVDKLSRIFGIIFYIAAALAAEDDVVVQKLPYLQLRKRLLAQGQVLDLPDVSETPLQRQTQPAS